MKKYIFIIIFAAFFLLAPGFHKDTANPAFAAKAQDKVIVYYFHTNYRCASCLKIEQYSSQALRSGFPKEMKEGKIVWKVINAEEAQNKHFIKDYQLYTKSLVIVKIKNGKQSEWKNLTKVWELLYNKNKVAAYVQDEIRNYLKEN